MTGCRGLGGHWRAHETVRRPFLRSRVGLQRLWTLRRLVDAYLDPVGALTGLHIRGYF